jgi:hypothetical protein
MDARRKWSDEKREQLRVLLDDGLSYGEAGRRLGVTKNMVSRQAKTLGVHRESPIRPSSSPRRGHRRGTLRGSTLPPLASLA